MGGMFEAAGAIDVKSKSSWKTLLKFFQRFRVPSRTHDCLSLSSISCTAHAHPQVLLDKSALLCCRPEWWHVAYRKNRKRSIIVRNIILNIQKGTMAMLQTHRAQSTIIWHCGTVPIFFLNSVIVTQLCKIKKGVRSQIRKNVPSRYLS